MASSLFMRLEALLADITTLDVDVVVNAANRELVRGGGVDGAIHEAAGHELQPVLLALAPCPEGESRLTPAFALPSRWIVHTVGPVWQDGRHDEDRLLASCYRSAMTLADEAGARSIAFPAISTGVFGFPRERAASVAIETLRSVESSVERVILVAYDAQTFELYERYLGDVDLPSSTG